MLSSLALKRRKKLAPMLVVASAATMDATPSSQPPTVDIAKLDPRKEEQRSDDGKIGDLDDTITTVSVLSDDVESDEEESAVSNANNNSNYGIPNSFELFIRDYVKEMSHHTSKRGKRTNAVNFYASSNNGVIKQKIRQSHTEAILSLSRSTNPFDDDHEDGLIKHLFAADHVARQFLTVSGNIHSMSDYLPSTLTEEEGYVSPQDLIFRHVEEHILTNVSMHYKTDGGLTLTTHQTTTVINWIETFTANLTEHCPDLVLCHQWQADLAKLRHHYLSNGVRMAVREQIHHCMKLGCEESKETDDFQKPGKDISENTTGLLVSGHPEMIMSEINAQLKHAEASLPLSYINDVLFACYDEVSCMVADLMLHVGTSWRSMTTMRLCSIINDARRLSDMIQSRSEEVLAISGQVCCAESTCEPPTPVIVRDLSELSLHTIHFLCDRLMYTLLDHDSAMLMSIGSQSWEEDKKGRAITRTMSIFRDFLSYIEGWLDELFLPYVLQKVFDLTLQIYVESFFCNTMAKGINDAAVVAENLGQDYLNLVIFFNGAIFQKYDGASGVFLADTMKSRLLIIQSLARLMNPSSAPSELEDDAIRVLAETTAPGDSNGVALLHVAGLRREHQKQKRSSASSSCLEKTIDWLLMIVSAEQSLDDRHLKHEHDQGVHVRGNTSCKSACRIIQLPDLRNSPYIALMKVGSKELYRQLPEPSRLLAEALIRMMSTPSKVHRNRAKSHSSSIH